MKRKPRTRLLTLAVFAFAAFCLTGCEHGRLYHPQGLEEVVSNSTWIKETKEGVSVVAHPILFFARSKQKDVTFRLVGGNSRGDRIEAVSIKTKGRIYDGTVAIAHRRNKSHESEILLPGEVLPLRKFTASWEFDEFLEDVFGENITFAIEIASPEDYRTTVEIEYRSI